MKILKSILVVIFICLSSVYVSAQNTEPVEPTILLTGKVNCIDPLNGTLAAVVVFNVSQGYGTITNMDGSFAIKMAEKDTIIFSTAEHKDYEYFIKEGEAFKDHEIHVVMVTDVVWLNTVTIIGAKSLEQFKRDVMALNLKQENQQLVLPLVNKYARQLATGDGETDLVGPLTYLQKKFNRHYSMKKKVEQVKFNDRKE
jgi:hypothetical protein